ncbi:MAG: hypothetical protein ABJA49_12085 [Betaproteobacteria bacterium]
MAPHKNTPAQSLNDPAPAPKLRFGRLLLVCLLAVIFCGWLVWFAMTYLPDCCGP